MYNNIIIAVDPAHGERGEQMATQARALMSKDCEVHLVSVVPELPGYVSFEIPEDIRAKVETETAASLHALAGKVGLKQAETRVRHGVPHREILAAADQSGADLIIIASHKPGLEDYLLGSTAGKVVRHARCSVLVVR